VQDLLLLDVTPLSLGLETAGGVMVRSAAASVSLTLSHTTSLQRSLLREAFLPSGLGVWLPYRHSFKLLDLSST